MGVDDNLIKTMEIEYSSSRKLSIKKKKNHDYNQRLVQKKIKTRNYPQGLVQKKIKTRDYRQGLVQKKIKTRNYRQRLVGKIKLKNDENNPNQDQEQNKIIQTNTMMIVDSWWKPNKQDNLKYDDYAPQKPI